jgi:hypothetical protein
MQASDCSVRDHRQCAHIHDRTIRVVSMVGRRRAGAFDFPLADWTAADAHPNPAFPQAMLIRGLTPGLEDQPGGAGQAERIRDSMVRAIRRALFKPTDRGPVMPVAT